MNEQPQPSKGNFKSSTSGDKIGAFSVASFIAAIVFAAVGMWMPPQGEISGSVLILVAQFLVVCATKPPNPS